MKRLFVVFCTLICCYNCQHEVAEKREVSDTTKIAKEEPLAVVEVIPIPFDTVEHLKNYEALKAQIRDRRSIMRRNGLNDDEQLAQVRSYLSKILIDSIFPYWLGTPWDFNGYTPTPRKGEVACGYFVSTAVRDAGVRLNRYKLAQKGAADIAKQLCGENALEVFSSLSKMEQFLSTQRENDLFVLGLDFHVGFVYRRGGQNYFAHSNYIGREGVVVEPFEESQALVSSQGYWLGNMSANDALLKQWLE